MDALPDPSLRRTVFAMAWPVVLRTSLNMSMQMIDMVMVGSLGAIALAAVGLGNQIFFFAVTVVQGFSVGTTALVAQSVGGGNIETAKKYASQSLAAVLLSTLLLGALVAIFAEEIVNGLVFLMPEKNQELVHLSSQYLGIIAISIPFRFTQIMVNGIFQGAGNTRTPLYLMIASNLLNIASNYVLIFGAGPVPALGVKGAAIATAGSGILIGLVGIALLHSRHSPILLQFNPGRFFHLQKDVLGRVLSIGMPTAVEQLGLRFGEIVYSMIVASLGPLAIAANQILLNANRMTRMPGHGFAIAATVLVGQSLGAEQKKRALDSGIEAARLALVMLSVAGLFYYFFPHLVALLFTRDHTVVEMSRYPLMLLALSQPAAAYLIAMAGGLRGAGDTRWAMLITLLSMFGIRMALTILLVAAGYGLTGVWLAMLVEAYFRAALLYRRFSRKIPQIKPLVGAHRKG